MANIFVDDSNATGTEDGSPSNPFTTIQEAITASTFFPASELVNIFVQDGTYAENLTINRGNLAFNSTNGAASTFINAAGGTAVSIGGFTTTEDISFDGFAVNGGSTGLQVASGTGLGELLLNDMAFADQTQTGVLLNDADGVGNVSITNSTFTDSGSGPGTTNGSGAIVLFDYHNDALIQGVTISNTDTTMDALADLSDNAIQISGFDQATYDVADPIGTVTFDDVSITGVYHKPAISIQGFTNLTDLTFTDVDIDATVQGFGGLLVFIDPIASTGADTAGTAGYPGNFAGNMPGATNTLDLSGINIINNGNMFAEYDVFVRGTDADDIYTGTNGRDILNALAEGDIDYGGDDQLFGNAGNDLLIGGTGDDILNGGADTDTATYGGTRDEYTIGTTLDGDGFANGFTSITDIATMDVDEGTDTLVDMEILQFEDQDVTVDNGIHLFDGSAQFVNSYDILETAVDASDDGSNILLRSGFFAAEEDIMIPSAEGGSTSSAPPMADGQILVDNDVSITGQGSEDILVAEGPGGLNMGGGSTTVFAVADTGSSGDSRGMFLVNDGIEFNMSDVKIDGNGHLIHQAVRMKGSGTFDNVAFNDINFNSSGPTYAGTAIAAFGAASDVDVTDSTFTNIGRVGVLYFGAATTGTFEGNSYTGKGDGDFLDYALDISAGANVTVRGNTISENRGVASSDGSTSAGLLVSTFFAPGTMATIEDNIFENNSAGIFVGFNASDTSTVNLVGTNTINSTHAGAVGLIVVGNAVVNGVNASLAGNAATVEWYGGDGDNNISGAYLADYLEGNEGVDTINGWDGDDEISGGDDGDFIDGGAGNDTIHGDAGNDSIGGGSGDDMIWGDDGDDTIDADDGNDVVEGGLGNDILNGNDGDDQLNGGDGDDTLNGGAGADFMIGGLGDDTYVVDNAGDAAFDLAGQGTDTVEASISYTLLGNIENLTLTGMMDLDGTGNGLDNMMIGNSGANTLSGGAGIDTINAGSGNDILNGDAGDDFLFGEDGDDSLFGGDGDDQLNGNDGIDTLEGGAGRDRLDGGAGDDVLNGGGDTDLLLGGTGNDTMDGGMLSDRVYGQGGNDLMYGGNGNDNMHGGGNNDVIYGGEGNDTINGGSNNDFLYGGDNFDNIKGGNGIDVIDGGGSNDLLWGGTGFGFDTLQDTFIFANTFGTDRIMDFEDGIDLIDFSGHTNFNNLADVLARASDDGTDLTIALNGQNTLIIENFTLAELDASDFVF